MTIYNDIEVKCVECNTYHEELVMNKRGDVYVCDGCVAIYDQMHENDSEEEGDEESDESCDASLVWETTDEHISNVLQQNGFTRKDYDDTEWYRIVAQSEEALKSDRIMAEALKGDDMSEQIEFAYAEINTQLQEAGVY